MPILDIIIGIFMFMAAAYSGLVSIGYGIMVLANIFNYCVWNSGSLHL